MKEITVGQILWSLHHSHDMCKATTNDPNFMERECLHARAFGEVKEEVAYYMNQRIADFKRAGINLSDDNWLLAVFFEGLHVGQALNNAPPEGKA
jgi:hypothetical protein